MFKNPKPLNHSAELNYKAKSPYTTMKSLALGSTMLLSLWSQSALADVPRVVTDITPVYSLVAQIMSGVGTPELIVQHGASPHHYQMKPSDAGSLQNADLIVWIGADLAPSLSRSIDVLAGNATKLTLFDLPGTKTLETRELAVFGSDDDTYHDHDDHKDEHHDEHDHDDHKDEHHDEHDHDGHKDAHHDEHDHDDHKDEHDHDEHDHDDHKDEHHDEHDHDDHKDEHHDEHDHDGHKDAHHDEHDHDDHKDEHDHDEHDHDDHKDAHHDERDHDDHKDAHHDEHDHDDHKDAHHDEHDHDDHKDAHHDEHDHDDHQHNHEGGDPHAWLDPVNAQYWLGEIAASLSELDPEHAAQYAANATASIAALDTLIEGIAAELKSTPPKGFIVFHDAYQYFESRFDVKASGAIATSAMQRPSAARIAALNAHLAEEDIHCIYSEPQYNSGLISALESDNKLTHLVIDPLGAALEADADFYANLMMSVRASLLECK